MAAGAVWNSRPVFFSSTFRDMHAERDDLRAHVFPELEERLRERRCHLEWIDLRWGVETREAGEEEAKELLVLKVCLAEVERSRPFLIGLLGDRYGWVPPEDRMKAAAEEAGFDRSVAGRSVTDLEIDFGVLGSAEQRRRCFFYFRDRLPYEQMPPALAAEFSEGHNSALGAADAAKRLVGLKERITKELPDRVRHYKALWDPKTESVTGLEELRRMVADDLWRELEAETSAQALKKEVSWQQTERRVLEQFIEETARGFVGRERILKKLIEFARNGTDGELWGRCVTGAAGAGKSALFSELHRRLEKEGVLLLSHAAGISPYSIQVDSMLRRWVDELAAELGITEPLGETASGEEIEQRFHELFRRASAERRVVVLIDALNQFEPTTRAQYLTWLPKSWPSNARLIATAIPGTASNALIERPGVKDALLPELEENESAEIARGICRRYHRTINPDALKAILGKRRGDGARAGGNALWLELAVEELNLLDADDFARAEREFHGTAEARLYQLLLAVTNEMPAEVEELYAWMLKRSEDLHGLELARAFVNLIAVSRSGWRESDLRRLMPEVSGQAWDDLKFAALRRTFRAHVVRRGAQEQWNFSHQQMRLAVERRNLAQPEMERELHRTIAGHLEELPRDDPVHETELMAHLVAADEKPRQLFTTAAILQPANLPAPPRLWLRRRFRLQSPIEA